MTRQEAKHAFENQLPVRGELNNVAIHGFITNVWPTGAFYSETPMYQITSVHPKRNEVYRIYHYAGEIQLLEDAE